MLGFITMYIYEGILVTIYITGFRVFFYKIRTRPYSLSSRVKSGPLESGRTGYLWVGFKLSSLVGGGTLYSTR